MVLSEISSAVYRINSIIDTCTPLSATASAAWTVAVGQHPQTQHVMENCLRPFIAALFRFEMGDPCVIVSFARWRSVLRPDFPFFTPWSLALQRHPCQPAIGEVVAFRTGTLWSTASAAQQTFRTHSQHKVCDSQGLRLFITAVEVAAAGCELDFFIRIAQLNAVNTSCRQPVG